jgi:hypothetical protein
LNWKANSLQLDLLDPSNLSTRLKNHSSSLILSPAPPPAARTEREAAKALSTVMRTNWAIPSPVIIIAASQQLSETIERQRGGGGGCFV